MLIHGSAPSCHHASACSLPRQASGSPDRFTPSELPFPRITAFMAEPQGYKQVDRVHHSGAWQLDLPEGRLYLCKRSSFGGKLTAFDGEGRVLWENDPGSCAHMDQTTICPESNTAYLFPYSAVESVDLRTGKSLGYRSLGNWSRTVFGTSDGQLLSVDNQRLHLYDRKLSLLHETPYGFGHARVDYDRASGLVTLQGPDWIPEEIRHAVYTDRGGLVMDEPLRTIHPGLPDGAGGLWQVVSQPDGSGFQVLRLRGQEVTRFPVEEGTVIAFPLKNGSFATLSAGEAVLRNPAGEVVARRSLPEKGLYQTTATPSGPLLCFEQEGVLQFDGELREVHRGEGLALTAALADGTFLVADRGGLRHHRDDGVEMLPDLWQAADRLGSLASYREGLPIVHLAASQGWESLLRDAERLLGAQPPPTLPVRLRAHELEIERPSSEEQARERLGVLTEDWEEWKSPVGAEQRQLNQMSRLLLNGEQPQGLDAKTWDQARIFSGYRQHPTSVSVGKAGYNDKILGIGTAAGEVKLVNLGPQGPQTGDQLPGAIIRTQLTPNGLVAVDEHGNLMVIEPHKWGNGIEPEKSCNPSASAPGASKTGLEMNETSVQVGAVRVKRRGAPAGA